MRSRGSIPGEDKIFLFSTPSRLALGATQPHVQWIRGTLSTGVKLSPHLDIVQMSRKVELYFLSSIRHGVVLNVLNPGLPAPYCTTRAFRKPQL